MQQEPPQETPWWAQGEGLRFACTGCGRCCTGAPGVVWITEEDAISMAEALDLELEIFERRYVRWLGNRRALRERRRMDPNQPSNILHDCVFLEEGVRCTVYGQRPVQCRTFPFWPEHLASPERWEQLGRLGCEGISPNAPPVPVHQIALAVQESGEAFD